MANTRTIEFFSQYFNKNLSSKKNVTSTEKFISLIDKKQVNDSQFDKVDQTSKVRINFIHNLIIDWKIINFNCREKLAKYIKNQIEKKVYYIFYIDEVDVSDVLDTNKELPLVFLVGDEYKISIPLMTTFIIFQKNSVINNMRLNFKIPNDETKNIIIFSTNNYLCCDIVNTNKNLSIIRQENNVEIKNNIDNIIYRKDNFINVKITKFKTRFYLEGLPNLISCEGEIE